MMTRNRIAGFELTLFGYTIEIVTVDHRPRVLAIWKSTRFIKRWGSAKVNE